MPYLKIAKEDHIDQFVLTTELAGLQYSRSWPWFLRTAQADCGCQVSYAAQMTQYLQAPGNLPPVRELGTDLYPSLNLPASASQAEVTAAALVWPRSAAVAGTPGDDGIEQPQHAYARLAA